MLNLSPRHAAEDAAVDSAGDSADGPLRAPAKPRLLVVDDIADNRVILSRLFQRRNFDVVQADCGIAALELIAAGSFDTILLDVNMPDISGLEVLRRTRLQHSPDTLPIIMVTANNNNAEIIEALELGANDYVAKPVVFGVAFARINAQVERRRASEALVAANAALNEANRELERRVLERTARLAEANEQLRNEVTARLRSEAQTQHVAHHDALTGLGNRLLFRKELQCALDEAPIVGRSLAVLFVDLDGFESVNNAHGHSVGDALLREIGKRLLGGLGDSVRIARLGGDEFAILQTNCGQPESAVALAERIVELISAPCRVEDCWVTVGASIGVAVSNGESQDAPFLLKAADLAMYRARAAGAGAYRFFDPETDTAVRLLRERRLNAIGG